MAIPIILIATFTVLVSCYDQCAYGGCDLPDATVIDSIMVVPYKQFYAFGDTLTAKVVHSREGDETIKYEWYVDSSGIAIGSDRDSIFTFTPIRDDMIYGLNVYVTISRSGTNSISDGVTISIRR